MANSNIRYHEQAPSIVDINSMACINYRDKHRNDDDSEKDIYACKKANRNSAIWLAWKDVRVCVSKGQGQSVTLLNNVSGYAGPGCLLAIMGPSGSGKSTLLDTLAGRLRRNATQSGQIWINGQERAPTYYGISAYVTQEDTLVGTLTVRESIMYSARLRLVEGGGAAAVERALAEMGLQECADTPVGNWHMRGLSGGEKRRLSIAIEILTRPRLLFLDEPTSGLDSASAFFVVKTLQKLALGGGCTVLSSIHQPSGEVFELFDHLILLSGGRTVYFGETKGAFEHFASAGFPCPPLRNPSDHFLRAINADFDKAINGLKSQLNFARGHGTISDTPLDTTSIVDILASTYKKSTRAWLTHSKVEEVSQMNGAKIEAFAHGPSFWTQTCILTSRSFKNMSRDMGYYWLRLSIYVVVSLCIGTIYYEVGTTYSSIMARASCMSYVSGFLTFMAIGGFPSFVEDMKVFTRERLNGHYGVGTFVMANSLSSLPFLFLISWSSATICYFMVKLHPGFVHFSYFLLCLFAGMVVVESLMMAIASIVPNYLMGIIIGAGIQGIFLLVAGFFRLPNDLPKPLWRYPLFYLSFHSYSLQGMYKNDFMGLSFDTIVGSEGGQLGVWALLPTISGERVLEEAFEIKLGRSKWWDLAILVCMALAYRVIFFGLIKVREHANAPCLIMRWPCTPPTKTISTLSTPTRCEPLLFINSPPCSPPISSNTSTPDHECPSNSSPNSFLALPQDQLLANSNTPTNLSTRRQDHPLTLTKPFSHHSPKCMNHKKTYTTLSNDSLFSIGKNDSNIEEDSFCSCKSSITLP